ncbi:MAG: hypothetical protein GVY11_00845 [Gammaproteobacteria bacterium]|jgi:hypothetical protein|nr:hypothetical protein [Gammaproteobacteria bacterium]
MRTHFSGFRHRCLAAVILAGAALTAQADPVSILPDDEASDYTIQAPRIYYVNRPGCGPIRQQQRTEHVPKERPKMAAERGSFGVAGSTRQVVGRTAVSGMTPREIYEAFHDLTCSPDAPEIVSNVVSDGSYLYWISDDQDGLVRVPVDQMIWMSTAPELVSAHPPRTSELVLLGDYIYILENGSSSTGFYRINKKSGSSTQLLNSSQTGSFPRDLQTDGLYMMWRHGLLGDILKRYTLSGGSQTDIVTGITGYQSAYPLIGLGVYVAQGNTIRTYLHSSGSLTNPFYTGGSSARINEIVTDGDALYFIEQNTDVTGGYTLYRLDFGEPADPIYAPPVTSPVRPMSDLARHEDSLYFLHARELKRIPTDEGVAKLTNLRIDGLEITQAIQNNSNSVPLIQGRRAVVRLFASSDDGAIPGVQAHLYRLNGSGTVIDGPLFPINLERAALFMRVESDPDRDSINDSFTFFLPPDWVEDSTLRLRAELNPYRFPLEPSYADNTRTTSTFDLEASPRIEARFVLFEYESASGDRFEPRYREDYLQTVSWIRRTYPVASDPGGAGNPDPGFRPSVRRVFNEDLGLNVNTSIDPPPADTECGRRRRLDEDDPDYIEPEDRNLCASWYVVCPALDTLRAAEELPTEIRQVGMVPDDLGFPRGWACGNGNVSTPSGSGDWGWDTDGSYADWYGGHEVGHGQGRGHPSQGNEECGHSASDPGFPWSDAQIGGAGYRGFDVGATGINPQLTPQVYSNDWHDVMSYCGAPGQWISDYTYEGIKDFSSRSADVWAPRGGAWVQVSGVIDPDSHGAYVAELRRWNTLGFSPEMPVPGDYRILFLNDGGATLASHDFQPHIGEDDSALIVGEFLPYEPGTAEVRIAHPASGEIGWSYSVSPNAPVVSGVGLVSPPSPVAGTVDLQWSASDSDGDDLTFDVLYSADDGESWQALRLNLDSEGAEIDTDELAGTSQGRFRVIANDGFHQGEAVSTGYTLANKTPTITRLNPADGQEFAFGQSVDFAAEVVDPQDGEINGIQWRDQTGFTLGIGTEFSQDNLIIGPNVITISATNSAGLTTEEVFTIYVDDSLEMPGPTLTVGPERAGWHVGEGETDPQTATLSVGNSGSGALSVSVSEDAPWLSVSQSGSSTPLELTLTADPNAIDPGNFVLTTMTIQGSGPGGDQTTEVPVAIAKGFLSGPVIDDLFSDSFEQ